MLAQGDLAELERIIDTYNIEVVVADMADICHAKATHLAENWQEYHGAGLWSKAARQVERLAGNLKAMAW